MVSFRTLKYFTVGVASTVMLAAPEMLSLNSTGTGLGFLGFTAPAVAKNTIRYKPPTLPGPVRTAGTGSRTMNCDMDKTATLLPLVPDGHIGQTVADRPPLLWYVSGAKSVEVSLVEPGVAKPIFEQTVKIQKPGIVQVNFPASAPALKPDKEYRWSVSVVCNPKRRTQDIAYTQAFIKRLPLSAQLKQQLASAKSDRERSQIYAEAGLWYDALATLATANATDPANEAIQADFYALLDQVGLNQAIAKEQSLSQVGNGNK